MAQFQTSAEKEAKMVEWQQRDWPAWLKTQLQFPFEANRTKDEDADDGLLTLRNPFPVGQRLTVLDLADVPMNDYEGVVVKVQRNANKGTVPLADLEVTPKDNANYNAVQEFVAYWSSK